LFCPATIDCIAQAFRQDAFLDAGMTQLRSVVNTLKSIGLNGDCLYLPEGVLGEDACHRSVYVDEPNVLRYPMLTFHLFPQHVEVVAGLQEVVAKRGVDILEHDVGTVDGLKLVDIENAVNEQDQIGVSDHSLVGREQVRFDIDFDRVRALVADHTIDCSARCLVSLGVPADAAPVAPRKLPILRVAFDELLHDVAAIEVAYRE
jgi:hypothetical protein